MKEYLIYKATNKINGNSYIGATSQGLKVRKYKHFQDAKASRPGCKIFNAAIRKYGKDVFEWAILKRSVSFDDMMTDEVELIAKINPEYNCTKGGQGMIGLVRTPEWMDKVSKALKGRKPHQNAIEASRDKSHQFKSIVCLNDSKFFISIISAADFYGINKKGISEVLAGRQVYCKGFSFAYSLNPLTKEECEKILNSLLEKRHDSWSNRKRKSVICVNDGKIYKSLIEASNVYNISNSRVMQLCQSGGSSKDGLRFKYNEP